MMRAVDWLGAATLALLVSGAALLLHVLTL